MIRHIVFFQGDNLDNIGLLKEELEKLPAKINEIKSYEVGLNIANSPRAWDMSLISVFENQEDLNTYSKHPEHLKVVEMIQMFKIKTCVVDSEC